MKYKVLKSGHFSEERFNQVGSIVEIDEIAANVAVEKGYLKPVSAKAKIKPVVKTKKEKKAKK